MGYQEKFIKKHVLRRKIGQYGKKEGLSSLVDKTVFLDGKQRGCFVQFVGDSLRSLTKICLSLKGFRIIQILLLMRMMNQKQLPVYASQTDS